MHEPTLSGLSILVVEDEALLRKQIGAHLEKRGADVTGAGTLEAARRLLADLSFDIVLLDVNLPDGRGTELLQGKGPPADSGIIVMTAFGRHHDDPAVGGRTFSLQQLGAATV